MIELIQAAFSPVNLVLTVPLLLMVLYWITVILGVLDVEFLNVDLPDWLAPGTPKFMYLWVPGR